MALVTTPATILKAYEYSETSKILRLLTRDQGLCSVIAKGARRPKSRFGGVLEPFTDGVATYYAKQGRDLHTLSDFELVRERQRLGRELVRFAGAGLITEIMLRFAPGTGDRRLFTQLRRALDRLAGEVEDAEAAILQETWRTIVALGFGPNLRRCTGCDGPIGLSDGRYFDLAGGGFHCTACGGVAGARSGVRELPAGARDELIGLVEGRGRSDGRLRTAPAQRRLIRDFLTYHVADGRPLNSFRFLEAQL